MVVSLPEEKVINGNGGYAYGEYPDQYGEQVFENDKQQD